MVGASPLYVGSLLILALEELESNALLYRDLSLISPLRLLELIIEVLHSGVYDVCICPSQLSACHYRTKNFGAACPFCSVRELEFAFRLPPLDGVI